MEKYDHLWRVVFDASCIFICLVMLAALVQNLWREHLNSTIIAFNGPSEVSLARQLHFLHIADRVEIIIFIAAVAAMGLFFANLAFTLRSTEIFHK